MSRKVKYYYFCESRYSRGTNRYPFPPARVVGLDGCLKYLREQYAFDETDTFESFAMEYGSEDLKRRVRRGDVLTEDEKYEVLDARLRNEADFIEDFGTWGLCDDYEAFLSCVKSELGYGEDYEIALTLRPKLGRGLH